MALTGGMRLGPYEIDAAIGAGGMGEVYRAYDTRLDRKVAIKILPERLSSSPERRKRFELEARAISKLNDPHICTLYDIGHQDGIDYLVMEYLEGETLAQRLQTGALTVAQGIQIAIEIAGALDKAHRQGVVHRDLKPGNIMLTKSGAKLMDFGLAKTTTAALVTAAANSPTVTQSPGPASPLTGHGMVVGTVQYMSPEQIEGKEADARSDIFSLGSVVYEMISGKRAFEGKSDLSLVAAILEKQPEPLASAQPITPPALSRAVGRCFEKDPDKRWQSAADFAAELEWVAAASNEAPVRVRSLGGRWPWVAGTIAALLVTALMVYRLARPLPEPVIRTSISAPPDSRGFHFVGEGFGAAVISPDGRHIAFTAAVADGTRRLWIRALDSLNAQELTGTQGAAYPFWSPDGRHIAFFADGKLKKIASSGGTPQALCEAGLGRGGTWNRAGQIVFSPDVNTPLLKVSENGGIPEPVTRLEPNETTHRWPYFLPDGRHFLFSTWPTVRRVWIGSLDGEPAKPLLDSDASALYAAPGLLLFIRDGVLMAQPFDIRHLALTGSALPIAEAVGINDGIGESIVSVSDRGQLLYSGGRTEQWNLEWRGLDCRYLGLLDDAGSFFNPRIAPDGNTVAASMADMPGSNVAHLYLFDLRRGGARTRFTFEGGRHIVPVWYPDGSKLAFASNTPGRYQLFTKAISGAAGEQSLLEGDYDPRPMSISRDGRFLAYTRRAPLLEVWMLPLVGQGAPFKFLAAPGHNISTPRFSPDGRWLAYVSNESGRNEVYVRPFPERNVKWQVSSDSGVQPVWRPDGKEIFFQPPGRDALYATTFTAGTTPPIGSPRQICSLPFVTGPAGWNYDLSPDGKRFLVMVWSNKAGPGLLTLVQNWTAELKK